VPTTLRRLARPVRVATATGGDAVVFRCNLCGARCSVAPMAIAREVPSCHRCASTVRERGAAELLALRQEGYAIDVSEGPLPLDEYLARCARAHCATSSPGLQLQQLLDDPELGHLLIFLLGSSQPIADSLIQNPELASIVFDRAELLRVPSRTAIEERGRLLSVLNETYRENARPVPEQAPAPQPTAPKSRKKRP